MMELRIKNRVERSRKGTNFIQVLYPVLSGAWTHDAFHFPGKNYL